MMYPIFNFIVTTTTAKNIIRNHVVVVIPKIKVAAAATPRSTRTIVTTNVVQRQGYSRSSLLSLVTSCHHPTFATKRIYNFHHHYMSSITSYRYLFGSRSYQRYNIQTMKGPIPVTTSTARTTLHHNSRHHPMIMIMGWNGIMVNNSRCLSLLQKQQQKSSHYHTSSIVKQQNQQQQQLQEATSTTTTPTKTTTTSAATTTTEQQQRQQSSSSSSSWHERILLWWKRFLGPKPMPVRYTKEWYYEVTLICTVFAITGSSTMMLVRPAVKDILGIRGNWIDGPWSYRICSLVIMTPVYATLLIGVGTIFGRHTYFKFFAIKIFSRFGIPPEFIDPHYHQTKHNFRKW